MATPLAIAATALNGHESSHLQTSPTRALWIGAIPGTTSSTDLLKVFSPYGPIESARVLANKNCGFCNFENLDDAVRARRALNGLEFLGDDVGPVKIGYARVPNKMPDTASLDNEAVNPVAAYNSLKRLTGATAVPLDEQISSGHLENFRSPMALQMAANNLNGIAPHSATALTASLQPAAGLSPSLVAAELEVPVPSTSEPVHDISEQQLLMRELSGGAQDTEAHVQSITGMPGMAASWKHTDSVAEPRPHLAYHSSIPPPVEDQFWARARNMDAPRLRDIRKRLEAPASQVPQAEVDGLAMELIEDIVPLASDYIGNVIVQKLFEKSSSGPRVSDSLNVQPAPSI
jgi:protein JSN1